jgi:hypothetical protein
VAGEGLHLASTTEVMLLATYHIDSPTTTGIKVKPYRLWSGIYSHNHTSICCLPLKYQFAGLAGKFLVVSLTKCRRGL